MIDTCGIEWTDVYVSPLQGYFLYTAFPGRCPGLLCETLSGSKSKVDGLVKNLLHRTTNIRTGSRSHLRRNDIEIGIRFIE